MRRKNFFLTGLLLNCLLLPLLLCVAGCWDQSEPNLLGVVIAVAYDYDPQTDLLHVIAQVANPLASEGGGGQGGGVGGEGGEGGGKNPTWVVETSGHTIYEAIKKTEEVSTRRLIWGHLEAVLFSEALAEKGLRPVLDYVDRERETRLIARPFVVQGDIRQLLKAKFPLEQLSGLALPRQLITIRLEDVVVPEIDTLRELFHHLSVPGLELILPRIIVQEEKKEGGGGQNSGGGEGGGESGGQSGGGSEAATGKPNPAKISGSALFRGDKLAGFFDETETAGYLWLSDNIRSSTMVFQAPGEKDKYLTVEVFRASTKIEPEVQGDRVRLCLTVRARGRLQDFTGLKVPLEEDFKNAMNRQMAAVIRSQIDRAWRQARVLNLDVFGFGHELYKTKPRDWKRLENKWQEVFPEIDLEVDVHAIIRSYGLIVDPIRIR